MMPLHGRPAPTLGRTHSENAEKARLDPGRNGRAGRDRPELFGRCRARKEKHFDFESGIDSRWFKSHPLTITFPTLTPAYTQGQAIRLLGINGVRTLTQIWNLSDFSGAVPSDRWSFAVFDDSGAARSVRPPMTQLLGARC